MQILGELFVFLLEILSILRERLKLIIFSSEAVNFFVIFQQLTVDSV